MECDTATCIIIPLTNNSLYYGSISGFTHCNLIAPLQFKPNVIGLAIRGFACTSFNAGILVIVANGSISLLCTWQASAG